MTNRILLRGTAVLVLFGAAACTDHSAKVLGPRPTQGNGMFQSYVALGNSITAGYQSGGINDSTQKQSYARLLAGQMGTRYAYASIANPGCPPPINNFNAQTRVTPTGFPPSTSTSCFLRGNTVAILNNVAVPGATSLDPDSSFTASSNLLTQLILGGQDQVQRARAANPTFASVWIGNNDVLAAAVTGLLTPVPGISPGVTDTATFKANYDRMIAALTAAPLNLKGMLVGVVKVTSAPILFSAQVLQSPLFVAALDQATGKTITVDPTTCTPTSSSLISFQIVPAIAAGQHPTTIECEKTPIPQYPLLGDIFVLDQGEIATLLTDIATINAYITSKASTIGFAYFDPNHVLDSLKGINQIKPTGPDFTAPTAPFGKWVSLDGVHPTAASHILLANYMIEAINAKYSTTLTKLPNP